MHICGGFVIGIMSYLERSTSHRVCCLVNTWKQILDYFLGLVWSVSINKKRGFLVRYTISLFTQQ